jgi:FlaA1/EpsC-like NDP-sugar epimerase
MRWLFVWAAQGCIFALSGFIAFLLRFDFRLPQTCLGYFVYALPIWIAVKSVIFQASNLNRWGLRYVTIADVHRIVIANCAGALLSWAILDYIAPAGFPRSIYLIDLILSLLGTAGLRVVIRMVAEAIHGGQGIGQEKRALIYGAGDAGITLLREIRNNPKLAYHVCGFLDDGLDKKGLLISGIEVLAGGDEIKSLVTKHNVAIILIAIPSATGVEMTRILELCHAAGVESKTVPGLGEVVEECGLVGQIREVAVEDLLGRNPVRLEVGRIREVLKGKVVLVTGAAGSIGSELCRQIARFQPAGIVGFEIAESPLFEIDREMKQRFPQVPFYPEIGNVQNRARLDDVLIQYRPTIVYHAAAYKHVPLMETHVFEAVENNVLGTYNGRTRYVAVRFGNVLGSNGSVIPIFKKQIAAGGPVTVTHPEMRRFFMTIPEACQLVLQASAVATGGQICVLDMGQPVKIVDLARNLILLSGLKPEKDIKIQFTGMRPGEKLYEELSTLLENTIPTEHEKVRIFVGNGVPEGNIHRWLDELRDLCAARDTGRLMVALKEVVLDYSPSADLLRRVVEAKDRDPHVSVLDRSLISHQAKAPIC